MATQPHVVNLNRKKGRILPKKRLKIVVMNKPIKETLDDKGFTIIGITDFLLRFIK